MSSRGLFISLQSFDSEVAEHEKLCPLSLLKPRILARHHDTSSIRIWARTLGGGPGDAQTGNRLAMRQKQGSLADGFSWAAPLAWSYNVRPGAKLTWRMRTARAVSYARVARLNPMQNV